MSRTRLDLFLTPASELVAGDTILVNDPNIGFGSCGHVLEASNVLQVVVSVTSYNSAQLRIFTEGAHSHIVLNDEKVFTVQKALR